MEAYIFDLLGTLAYLNNGVKFPKHEEMLVKNFKDISLTEEEKTMCLNIIKEQKVTLFEDSFETIKKLKEKGYKLAILSNIYEVSGKLVEEKLKDFLNLFDFVGFSYKLGKRKPDAEIFKIALGKIKTAPENAFMVGDEEKNDILPAVNLGMKAILIDRTKQNLNQLI